MLNLTERVGAEPKVTKGGLPSVSVSIGGAIPFDDDVPPTQPKKKTTKSEDKKA